MTAAERRHAHELLDRVLDRPPYDRGGEKVRNGVSDVFYVAWEEERDRNAALRKKLRSGIAKDALAALEEERDQLVARYAEDGLRRAKRDHKSALEDIAWWEKQVKEFREKRK